MYYYVGQGALIQYVQPEISAMGPFDTHLKALEVSETKALPTTLKKPRKAPRWTDLYPSSVHSSLFSF